MKISSSLVTCDSVYSDYTNYVPLPLEVFWDDSVLFNIMQICKIQFSLGWLPRNNNQSFNSITFNTANFKLVSMPVSMVIIFYYDSTALQKVHNNSMVILYCITYLLGYKIFVKNVSTIFVVFILRILTFYHAFKIIDSTIFRYEYLYCYLYQ